MSMSIVPKPSAQEYAKVLIQREREFCAKYNVLLQAYYALLQEHNRNSEPVWIELYRDHPELSPEVLRLFRLSSHDEQQRLLDESAAAQAL